MAIINIPLPNNWDPRPSQKPVWNYLDSGGTRAIVVAHRRWGKDDVALHRAAVASSQRVGNYWHLLPEYGQCRRAIWDAINPRSGLKRIDEAFPHAMRRATRNQDMSIEFVNGSRWQLVGSDSYNSLVGSPPVGVVFSEFALADPRAWGYIRPILADNGGWAFFITTYRGKNHAWNMRQAAEDDPLWHAETITVADSGAFTQEQLDQELKEYMSLFGDDEGYALFMQEYYCDVDTPTVGSYFGREMRAMKKEGRIAHVPHDPQLPVGVGWDIGVRDPMALVFTQRVHNEIRVIDYYETRDGSLQSAVQILQRKPYTYSMFHMPHDIKVREWGNSAQSRYETALSLGVKPINLVKRVNSMGDKIHMIRSALPQIIMDAQKCAVLIQHLKSYHKKWNPTMRIWEDQLVYHGPESHGVDALATELQGYAPAVKVKTVSQIMAQAGVNFRGVWG